MTFWVLMVYECLHFPALVEWKDHILATDLCRDQEQKAKKERFIHQRLHP